MLRPDECAACRQLAPYDDRPAQSSVREYDLEPKALIHPHRSTRAERGHYIYGNTNKNNGLRCLIGRPITYIIELSPRQKSPFWLS
jgi:hypothetical protein